MLVTLAVRVERDLALPLSLRMDAMASPNSADFDAQTWWQERVSAVNAEGHDDEQEASTRDDRGSKIAAEAAANHEEFKNAPTLAKKA